MIKALASTIGLGAILVLTFGEAKAQELDTITAYNASARLISSAIEGWVPISKAGQLPQIIFGIGGTQVFNGCSSLDGDNHIWGSYFCPQTNTIVLESSQILSLAKSNGDGSVPYVIAHEVGHWLQANSPDVFNAARLKPPYIELQADCIAGSILSSAWFGLRWKLGLDKKDIKEIVKTAYSVGDYGSSHGTPKQRVNAFLLGFNEVPIACTEVIAKVDFESLIVKETLIAAVFNTNQRTLDYSKDKLFYVEHGYQESGDTRRFAYNAQLNGKILYRRNAIAQCRQGLLTDEQSGNKFDAKQEDSVGSKILRYVCAN